MVTKRNAVPRRQMLIERNALSEHLTLSLDHPLTLVIAPTGYGKTTLVKQFIHHLDIATTWQILDKQDQDMPTLFENARNALTQVAPTLGSIMPPHGTAPGELATLMTTYLQKHVRDNFLYIIDDIHWMMGSPDARSWLKAFVATLPPTCHLILIGQALPPLALDKLIARADLVSIGQENLSFSRREVQMLAEKVKTKISDQYLDQIMSRMQGWPAGTVLALQPLPQNVEAAIFSNKKAPEALFEILADRLFQAQPVALQAFLLRSSTLVRMTPTLCNSVLGLKSSASDLTEAVRSNLFITETPGGLMYHSLFRSFLQQKLHNQDPVQFVQFHIKAAKWFEAENRLELALDHYAIAHQWQQAADIAERIAHIYSSNAKIETLLRWENLFNAVEVHAPRFFHFCAMIHRDRYEYDLALLNADRSEIGFQADGNSTGLIQIALLRATIDNQRGDFQEAFEKAQPFSCDMSIIPNLRGYALAIVGTAAFHLNRLDEALALLEAALPLWRDTGDQFALAHLLLTLEVVNLRLGRFDEASRCLQEVVTIRREIGESVSIVAALNNLGNQYHLLGRYQEALQTLAEGLQLANRVPDNHVEGSILWTLGDVQRDQGAFHEAAESYRQGLQKLSKRDTSIRINILLSSATMQRWKGNLDDSQQLAHEALMLAQDHNLRWEEQLAKLAVSAVDIYRGQFEQIRSELEAAILDWTVTPSCQLVFGLGVYAYGALLTGDYASADRALKIAIRSTHHPANLQPLIAEIWHTPILKTFVEARSDRYTMLMDGVQLLAEVQIADRRQLWDIPTYDLRVSVLGSESIERHGHLIPLSNWQAASAREMFFYLLFKGASSREKIGLALWPDSSAQQVRQKFHSTLSRIRDAVGNNVVIFDGELYSINPNITLWCDVIEFQSLIHQAKIHSVLLPHTESLWQRIIKLYKGDFLPAYDVDWVTNYRESLREMYVESLFRLGNCMCARGNARDAVDQFREAIKIDPYREDIHRALIKGYHQLGENGLVSQHVNDLKRLLAEDLGTTPSIETLQLIRRLLS